MQRVLIVHASRHGGTAGIADRIGTVMRAAGVEAVVARAADMPDPRGFDGCVVGAGAYMGSWVKEGTVFLTDIPRPSPECRSGCSAAVRCSGRQRQGRRPIRSPTHSDRRAAPAAAAGGRSSSSAPPSIPATTASFAERSIRTTRLERCRSDLSG